MAYDSTYRQTNRHESTYESTNKQPTYELGSANRRVRFDIQMNDSSMTKKSMKQQLWIRYSIASDEDRKFVHAKIIVEIAGKESANKYRTEQRVVSEMVD